MIPLPGIRDKGAGLQLGARQPGETGPFGEYGDGDQDDEQQLDDDQTDD
jgi:hypothetical protein